MVRTPPRKIFQSLPLGEMTTRPAAAASPPRPRANLPEAPAYRVFPLGRGAGMPSAATRWRTEAMRSHRAPALLWFTRGQGRITVSGVTRGFGPHNLIFLPKRTMYGYEPVGQVMGYMVHLPDDPVLALPGEPLHMRFREVFQQNEITALIENLKSEIENDRPGRDRAMALQAGMIAVWLERQIEIMPDYDLTPDASRRLAAAFTALVEEELCGGHTVAHFAAELGVTPTHLTRACNIACGRSASAILTDRLHFEARRLLSETKMPVKDIAAALGFQSAAYFSRAFHKQTGRSPREFRRGA
ncbi:helix-turn-helix domain-containing protein [Celeribacter indicus]|uniref:AraC family transcriptional regulator n=1 Tax=Celeribacter indicus TaxID=1208324 RepID=A0A0B5DV97_9RHOB|nr:AraC family transcriptional regulator [Celeribacter indicus]AJE47338.1 AraC family transcriptional regulator [Celeribacter indicus]SDW03882.1 transcriptional regulator, AraC family [Celeribacter indicus]